VREKNEDRYLIYQEGALSLCAVADGMGGHAAGEVASTLALETVRGYLTNKGLVIQEHLVAGNPITPFLEEMLAEANRIVLAASLEKPEYNGMGTTLTLLLAISDQFWTGHIGDSRAYLIREGRLEMLTDDHTLVSQLARNGQISEDEIDNHPQRHILTRALGTDEKPVFDLRKWPLAAGDIVLLCTDGLHGLVENDELLRQIEVDSLPEDTLSRLVSLANERGGTDNITVVLVYDL
jgi:protein phosphatase